MISNETRNVEQLGTTETAAATEDGLLDAYSQAVTSVVERVTVTYDYSAASTVTPEPVTALLFGSGLIALGLFRRQRR